MFKSESEMKRGFCPIRGGMCLGSGCNACIPHHARETETGQRVPLVGRHRGNRATVFYYCGQYEKPCEADNEVPPLEI